MLYSATVTSEPDDTHHVKLLVKDFAEAESQKEKKTRVAPVARYIPLRFHQIREYARASFYPQNALFLFALKINLILKGVHVDLKVVQI